MLPLKVIDSYVPAAGTVVELGCGEGVISSFLAKKKHRNIVGVDIDKKRLPKLRKKNLKFIVGDMTNYKIQKADAVIISDVLHHLTFNNQKRVLKSVQENLTNKGVLIIKEIDTQEFIRSKLSRFWDFVFYPGDKIYFNDAMKLKRFLNKLGFKVSIQRVCRLFPGSTTLLVCHK